MDEHNAATGPAELLQQVELVGVAAGKAVEGVGRDDIELVFSGDVP